MLMHNNNKLKGHLFLNGTELITWLQTRLLSDHASTVAKRDQYLMNSKRWIFRNINVSYTWVHKVTSTDQWIWHYTQPEECIFLIDLSISNEFKRQLKWIGLCGTFVLESWRAFYCVFGSPHDLALCFNYRCLLSGSSGNTTNTIEKWKA